MEIISVVIAGAALVLSLISWVQSNKAQNLQNKINELDLKLKQFELAEIEKQKSEQSRSCVEARVIEIGRGKHRLKVWNSGNTTVYDVSAKFKEKGIFLHSDGKMPFDQLDPQKSFEVVVIAHDNSVKKFHIITEWTDTEGQKQSKVQMGDI